MTFLELLDKYPVMASGAIGSTIGALGALAGVALTVFSNYKAKDKDAKNARDLRILENSIEFEKEHLIKSVIEFLEADLKLISYVYECGLTKESPSKKTDMGDHIRQMAMVEARVKLYGDESLEKKFTEFTHKRIEIGNEIFSEYRGDQKEAYNKLQEAISLASEILKSIKCKLKKIET